MGYINFKEEVYKLKIQFQNRKKNNEKIYSYIIKHKDKMKNYNGDDKYSYKNIKDELIGKKGILDEQNFYIIKNQDILCANFYNCTFANVKFINCNIIGCKFYNSKFIYGGVIFENCIFIMENSLQPPTLNSEANYSCEFYDCELFINFRNCDLSYAIFENTLIRNTFFEINMMKSVILNNCELRKIKISDCDLSVFKTYQCYVEDFEFYDKYKTKFDEKTFFDKLIEIKKDRDEAEGIYMTYETIADKFKENSLNNNFGEYYYLCKKTESKVLNPLPKIGSFFYRTTCGYGERPFNALIFGVVSIVIFALIFLFVGVDINENFVVYKLTDFVNLDLIKFIQDFNQTLALSSGIFLGVGGYSCEPVKLSLLVSNIEMIVGVTIMGIGVGTFVKKIIR